MAKTKRKKEKSKVADDQIQRYFIDFKEKLLYYRGYLERSGFSEQEKAIRIEETDKLLKEVEKFRKISLNPIESVETILGTQFKVGDKFQIKGNLQSKYRILQFPNSTYARGLCDNPNIGEPYICEAYIENIVKVKEEKLPKWIEVGAYFQLLGSGTFFKIVEVLNDTKQIVGTNKLQYMGAKTNAKVHYSHVKEATKKEYKAQHEPPKKKKDDKKDKKKNKFVDSSKKVKKTNKKAKKKKK